MIGKAPNVLIVHLQRIVFDFQTFDNKKLGNRYEFPMILELHKYVGKNKIELTEEEKADPRNKQLLEILETDDDEYVYRLVGVNIHRGQANSGHYWSLIQLKRGESEPNPMTDEEKWKNLSLDWREFNDESVSFFLASTLS